MPTISWPGTSGSFGSRELAVDDVQVGAADAAGPHVEEDLPGARRRHRQLGRTKWRRAAASTIARMSRREGQRLPETSPAVLSVAARSSHGVA